ncbi:glucosamine-6-phosphate isomerase [Radiomyces spectabilis]|uniref:glucosamine-6-phosphate isomerase n=1 Tax=Radiomyces spectabilis TaxID=64574 RepID=UPI00221FA8EA|nr:glucosamine-6-phosphate isomerase [Radiomyces spectabilis]KAI8371408.1 glucosamine-6-phosphate isomerase [Radiomyces spectabilis]
MRLIIQQDSEQVSSWVAHYIKERINQYQPSKDRPFVLGLPTGTSALRTYYHLIQLYKAGEISFKHVVTFNMHEYVGIPRDQKESSYSYMWERFFQHIDISPENIHFLDGNAADLDLECRQYEAKIACAGGIELFLGSIGSDGHVAFNEPGSSLTSRTRAKTLSFETITANARFFGNDIAKVPKVALTVGIATVMDAREVCIIITGAHRSIALAKCVEGGVNHMWSISGIQMHPKGLIVCDEDATLELHVKTVKYFKSIDHVQRSLIGKQHLGLQGQILSFQSTPSQSSPHDMQRKIQQLLTSDASDTKDEYALSDEKTSTSPTIKKRRLDDESSPSSAS